MLIIPTLCSIIREIKQQFNHNIQYKDRKDEKYDLLDSSNAFLGTDLSFGQLQNIDGIKIEINKLKEFDEVSLLVSNPEIIIDTLQASFSFGEIMMVCKP